MTTVNTVTTAEEDPGHDCCGLLFAAPDTHERLLRLEDDPSVVSELIRGAMTPQLEREGVAELFEVIDPVEFVSRHEWRDKDVVVEVAHSLNEAAQLHPQTRALRSALAAIQVVTRVACEEGFGRYDDAPQMTPPAAGAQPAVLAEDTQPTVLVRYARQATTNARAAARAAACAVASVRDLEDRIVATRPKGATIRLDDTLGEYWDEVLHVSDLHSELSNVAGLLCDLTGYNPNNKLFSMEEVMAGLADIAQDLELLDRGTTTNVERS